MELALKQSGIPSFGGIFAKITEALAAAGCAGFFVLATVLGLEVTAENARQLAQPTVTLSISAIQTLSGAAWGIAPKGLAPAADRIILASSAPRPEAAADRAERADREALLSVMRSVQLGREAVMDSHPAPKTEPTIPQVAPQGVQKSPPALEARPEAPALKGWVAAGQQLLFPAGPMRPREVTFSSAGAPPVRVAVASDGRVTVPGRERGAPEYSFQAPVRRPGPALVSLLDLDSQPGEAIQAAVEVGPAAEAIDFRKSRQRLLKGRIFEASEANAAPVAGVEVQLAGDGSRVAITDAEGAFDLGSVRVAAGGKVFVEATRPGGFKHRFEVPLPARGGKAERGAQQDLEFFLFSEEQIQDWSAAFEGGLSPQSGWIVTAAPGKSRGSLIVEPTALTTARAIVPEIYALDSGNAIRAQADAADAKSAHASRWLSVEVPEGSARVGFKDSKGQWVDSTWVPVSSGVINVILLGAGR